MSVHAVIDGCLGKVSVSSKKNSLNLITMLWQMLCQKSTGTK